MAKGISPIALLQRRGAAVPASASPVVALRSGAATGEDGPGRPINLGYPDYLVDRVSLKFFQALIQHSSFSRTKATRLTILARGNSTRV